MDIRDIANHVSTIISEKYGCDHPYYDGSTLLSRGTENTRAYIVTTNRTDGKTTYYGLLTIEYHRITGRKVCYIVRHINELKDYGIMFSDISSLYYSGEEIVTKILIKDMICTVSMGGEIFCYVVCLKKYVGLKKFSPIFGDTDIMIMEEYQLEDGRFLRDEIGAFRSLYRTIARGGGEQIRPIICILLGNPVTLLNPYLLQFGIAERYKRDTEYIQTRNTVAEFRINLKAQQKMKEDSSSQLFGKASSYDYGADFLVDDSRYMEKCSGKSRYLYTIIYDNNAYGVRQYLKGGEIHVGDKPDPTCKDVLAFREYDRAQNIDLLERYDYSWKLIRNAYKYGKLRFGNFSAKHAIFSILGVDMYC